MAEIDNLLKPMVLLNSSDLHLRVGIKPRYRLDGRLKSPTEVDVLPRDLLLRMLKEILSDVEWQTYEQTRGSSTTRSIPMRPVSASPWRSSPRPTRISSARRR